jgi:SpoVK/Ycf46/Vps4 family AAA+-type ATPase
MLNLFSKLYVVTQADALKEANDNDKSKVHVDTVIEQCTLRLEGMKPVRFEDVVGFKVVVRDIKSAILLPLLRPSAFQTGVKPFGTFLIYGLPGNQILKIDARRICPKSYYILFLLLLFLLIDQE